MLSSPHLTVEETKETGDPQKEDTFAEGYIWKEEEEKKRHQQT